MRYLSVCSGVEAATVAWSKFGWELAGVAEIDPFACDLLRHHYGAGRPQFMPSPSEPGIDAGEAKDRAKAIKRILKLPQVGTIPNYGDLTQFEEWPDVGTIDLLVGGTPCQSFSVAGLGEGLSDPRGRLAIHYLAACARYRPRWFVWENVAGVLSSNDGRDFASFLGLATGQKITPPETGWKTAGAIRGYRNAYGVAWRVLDSQYVRTSDFPGAVPQRRRRVFVVGYLGDWRRAFAVLSDTDSMRGDSAPRREAGKGFARNAAPGAVERDRIAGDVAPTVPARKTAGGGMGTDFECDGGLIPEVAACLDASYSRLQGASGQDANHGHSHLVPEVSNAFAARDAKQPRAEDNVGIIPTEESPIAFTCKDDGGDAGEVSPTVRAMNHSSSHANGGGQVAIAFNARQDPDSWIERTGPCDADGTTQAVAIQERAGSASETSGPGGAGWRDDGAAFTHEARTKSQAVAFAENSRGELRLEGQDGSVAGSVSTGGGKPGQGSPTVAAGLSVRRLTPLEVERIFGFPDNYTLFEQINGRMSADSPRYRACGLSMTANAMQAIGSRIALVDETARAAGLDCGPVPRR